MALAYILLTIGLKTTPPVTASLVSGIEPVLNQMCIRDRGRVVLHDEDLMHEISPLIC